LAAGILTGKYKPDVTPPANTRMAGHPMGAYLRGRSQHKRTLAVREAAKTIAGNSGVTMAQVALTWLAARRRGQRPRVDFPYGGTVIHQMTRRIEGGWPM
jgi:aryl-alcohol dehydrogenase-like predicted oxidoreductase